MRARIWLIGGALLVLSLTLHEVAALVAARRELAHEAVELASKQASMPSTAA